MTKNKAKKNWYYPPSTYRYRERHPNLAVSVPLETKNQILDLIGDEPISTWLRGLIHSALDPEVQKEVLGEIAIAQALGSERERLKEVENELEEERDERFGEGREEGYKEGYKEGEKSVQKAIDEKIEEVQEQAHQEGYLKAVKRRLSLDERFLQESKSIMKAYGKYNVASMLGADVYKQIKHHGNFAQCLKVLYYGGFRFVNLEEIFKNET